MSPPKKLTIFYIDDEKDLCDIFEDLFSSEFVTVKTFNDAATLSEEIKVQQPDLIFLDYRLNGTTGDQLAQHLPPNISKFLVTGDIEVQTKYKFKKILAKPFVESEIASILEHCLATLP